MSNETNNRNESTQSINRDNTIDIMSLLQANSEEEMQTEVETEAPITIKKNLTPIEKMKMEKANNSGIVIENKKTENEAPKSPVLDDDRMNDLKKYDDELTKQILAAEKLDIKKPTSPIEMASVMDQISEYADTIEVTDEDRERVKNILEGKIERVHVPKKKLPDTATEEEIEEAETERRTHEELVNVVIDKTKMGATFMFTEEEKKKLTMSERIHVTEVEDVELKSFGFRKPDEGESFGKLMDTYQVSSATASVVLPASLWRCTVKGLSFSEMADISLQNTDFNSERLNKKLSVIYNNIINTSIGKFDSYSEFLTKLSYSDIDYLTYALTIATFPEIDQLAVDCKVERCRQTFNVDYQPRGLLQMTNFTDNVLKAMEKVQTAPSVDEAIKLAETSRVTSYKAIKLPVTGFIIEVGFASAWDYLHEVGSLISDAMSEDYEKRHPEDINGTRAAMTLFLNFIRAIRIPTKDGGKPVRYDKPSDIVDIMYKLNPRDISIITAIASKYSRVYTPTFMLKDIVCPHCKTHTPSIPIGIDQLVFRKFTTLEATDVDLDEMLGI